MVSIMSSPQDSCYACNLKKVKSQMMRCTFCNVHNENIPHLLGDVTLYDIFWLMFETFVNKICVNMTNMKNMLIWQTRNFMRYMDKYETLYCLLTQKTKSDKSLTLSYCYQGKQNPFFLLFSFLFFMNWLGGGGRKKLTRHKMEEYLDCMST